MKGIQAQLRAQRGNFSLNVTLQLPDRGITALFGPSGCGKTTLLRAIAGLEKAAGYCCFGRDIWQDDAARRWVPPERRPMAYVFQQPSLFPHLSVRENLAYGFRRTPVSRRCIAFDDAVGWLGLEAILQRHPSGLSGGERQRVAIARALLCSPELLLLDEPLSALDSVAKAVILPYLERLHRELSIPMIYVSHDIEEVARISDYIIQLENGRIKATGPAIRMLSSLSHRTIVGEEPGAVIEAKIRMHDDENYLTMLQISGGQQLIAPRLSAKSSTPVRIRIPAKEVSISLGVPHGTSILNILPARIIGFKAGDPGRVLVQLELLGGNPDSVRLLSRISHYSWQQLELHTGKQVYAQIKSMCLESTSI